MRGIALSTCVTLLVPEERRDRANGMVGTVTGVSFALTSVFSGLAVGGLGMGWAYLMATLLMAAALAHLGTIRVRRARARPDRMAIVSRPSTSRVPSRPSERCRACWH